MNENGSHPETPPIPPRLPAHGAAVGALFQEDPAAKRAVAGRGSLVCVLAAFGVFLLMLLTKPG
jgi:hypothetical protein